MAAPPLLMHAIVMYQCCSHVYIHIHPHCTYRRTTVMRYLFAALRADGKGVAGQIKRLQIATVVSCWPPVPVFLHG